MQPGITTTEFNEPGSVIRALGSTQRARIDERLTGGTCVGIKAWYTRSSSLGDVSAASGCSTPGGNQIGTLSKDYDNEVLAPVAGNATDGKCNNYLDFETESRIIVKQLVAKCRKKLNQIAIARLGANAQVNLDTMSTSSWDWTSQSPNILIPAADLKWENLGELDAIVSNNNFGDYIGITGRNFYNDQWVQNFLKANADGPAGSLAYGSGEWYFDIRDLDRTLGLYKTFAVDKTAFVFWNTVLSPAGSMKQIDADTWVTAVQDPDFKYNKNGVLTPVLYELEVSRTCVGRNANNHKTYTWNYYMRFIGGIQFAPAGPNGETGILSFLRA